MKVQYAYQDTETKKYLIKIETTSVEEYCAIIDYIKGDDVE